MKNPKVSVIVPVYNGEKYIGECIESIIGQTYKNLEIFLVDDDSKDDSLKICKDYAKKDSRITVLHQKNSGVSAARNNALKKCTGKYICLIDQDDYISNDYVSYFLKLITDTGAEVALTPTAKKVNSNQATVSPDPKDDITAITGKEAALSMFYYKFIVAPWNKMISNSLIKNNNISFNDDLFGGEGFDFSEKCFQYAQSVVVGSRQVYCYRIDNPNSGMTKFSLDVIKSSINAQKYIKETLIIKDDNMYKACAYANWHTHCDCLNTIIGCKVKNKYPALYHDIKKVCRRDALLSLKAPISGKEKVKGLLYFISPYLAAKFINHFRLRKFTIEK